MSSRVNTPTLMSIMLSPIQLVLDSIGSVARDTLAAMDLANQAYNKGATETIKQITLQALSNNQMEDTPASSSVRNALEATEKLAKSVGILPPELNVCQATGELVDKVSTKSVKVVALEVARDAVSEDPESQAGRLLHAGIVKADEVAKPLEYGLPTILEAARATEDLVTRVTKDGAGEAARAIGVQAVSKAPDKDSAASKLLRSNMNTIEQVVTSYGFGVDDAIRKSKIVHESLNTFDLLMKELPVKFQVTTPVSLKSEETSEVEKTPEAEPKEFNYQEEITKSKDVFIERTTLLGLYSALVETVLGIDGMEDDYKEYEALMKEVLAPENATIEDKRKAFSEKLAIFADKKVSEGKTSKFRAMLVNRKWVQNSVWGVMHPYIEEIAEKSIVEIDKHLGSLTDKGASESDKTFLLRRLNSHLNKILVDELKSPVREETKIKEGSEIAHNFFFSNSKVWNKIVKRKTAMIITLIGAGFFAALLGPIGAAIWLGAIAIGISAKSKIELSILHQLQIVPQVLGSPEGMFYNNNNFGMKEALLKTLRKLDQGIEIDLDTTETPTVSPEIREASANLVETLFKGMDKQMRPWNAEARSEVEACINMANKQSDDIRTEIKRLADEGKSSSRLLETEKRLADELDNQVKNVVTDIVAAQFAANLNEESLQEVVVKGFDQINDGLIGAYPDRPSDEEVVAMGDEIRLLVAKLVHKESDKLARAEIAKHALPLEEMTEDTQKQYRLLYGRIYLQYYYRLQNAIDLLDPTSGTDEERGELFRSVFDNMTLDLFIEYYKPQN